MVPVTLNLRLLDGRLQGSAENEQTCLQYNGPDHETANEASAE